MKRLESGPRDLSDDDYHRLLIFRDGLRRFLHWSEQQAGDAGMTSAQHQLLLAIRGHGSTPSVGDLAAHLLLKHHSVVELVDRAARAGLVRRLHDDTDQRVVRVELTALGQRKLRTLAQHHLDELSRIGPELAVLWGPLLTDTPPASLKGHG
jgi:DNA-binding MarR family transcriptional regulator